MTPNIKEVFIKTQEMGRQNPDLKIQHNQDMITNRWRYLSGSLAFVLLCGFFMGLGIYLKAQIPWAPWVVWMICSGCLFVLGAITFGWYLWLVIKQKTTVKNKTE